MVTENWVDLGHGRTRYLEAGAGRPVLFLHGVAYESPDHVDRLVLVASGGAAARTLPSLTEFTPRCSRGSGTASRGSAPKG